MLRAEEAHLLGGPPERALHRRKPREPGAEAGCEGVGGESRDGGRDSCGTGAGPEQDAKPELRARLDGEGILRTGRAAALEGRRSRGSGTTDCIA